MVTQAAEARAYERAANFRAVQEGGLTDELIAWLGSPQGRAACGIAADLFEAQALSLHRRYG